MRRRLIGPILGTVLALAVTGTALGSSCANVSRAPADCGFDCSGPVIQGNWVWLPSIGVPVPFWGFIPPGTPDAQALRSPGAGGNYTNGFTLSLLGHSAYCLKGVNA